MPSARTNPPVTLSAEMQRKDRPDRSRDSASGQPGSCGPSLQLLAPGDASESICIVLTGDVDVMLPELPVKGQSVVNLKPGGVFGESAFFSENPHTMSASAGDTGATLLVLDRTAYDKISGATVGRT